jgi:FeS assembly SUF system regulator
MLRMSKMTDYGTVVMTYLAREPGRVHNAAEVATNIHVPLTTVSKILKILARGGLLSPQRGAKGGYMLARPPARITVADIIDAMEGRHIGLTECSSSPGVCVQESSCSVRGNWQRINDAVRTALEGVTLEEMLRSATVHAVDISGLRRDRRKAVA